MADHRATWVLVLEAARLLTTAGQMPFRLSELIAEVQRMDPERSRTSIQPVVQGMTHNAGKGPPSPCGKVLERVEHGYYRLRDNGPTTAEPAPAATTQDSARRHSRPRRYPGGDVDRRIDELIDGFEDYLVVYDHQVPFVRSGQFERHHATIIRRRALGTAVAAATDAQFCALLYATLQAWGVGRRGSRLAPPEEFAERLAARTGELAALDGRRLDDPALDLEHITAAVDELIATLGVVDNYARIVAGTKTLHHLLPELVPPMDRAWTGAFFGWTPLDPQHRQPVILAEAFQAFARIARATSPLSLVGEGWRTSPTKLLDNALIGYCLRHRVGTEAP